MKPRWITAAVLAASAVSGHTANKFGAADSARGVFRQVEESALRAANDIDPLQQMGNDLSAESNYEHLMALRDEVNRMGKAIASLQAQAGSLAPGERQALEKIQPMLQQTAVDTQKAIDFFDTKRADLWTTDYRTLAAGAYEGSERMARTLHEYLKYSKTNEHVKHLRQDLGVTGE
jgi:hypothetical protein